MYPDPLDHTLRQEPNKLVGTIWHKYSLSSSHQPQYQVGTIAQVERDRVLFISGSTLRQSREWVSIGALFQTESSLHYLGTTDELNWLVDNVWVVHRKEFEVFAKHPELRSLGYTPYWRVYKVDLPLVHLYGRRRPGPLTSLSQNSYEAPPQSTESFASSRTPRSILRLLTEFRQASPEEIVEASFLYNTEALPTVLQIQLEAREGQSEATDNGSNTNQPRTPAPTPESETEPDMPSRTRWELLNETTVGVPL